MKYGDVIHNTEDKSWWHIHGESFENVFVNSICPRIGLKAEINPAKTNDKTAPDLLVNGKIADLKTQNTPFFTSGKYKKKDKGKPVSFDPSYTVTFNVKDYERYKRLYPDIEIFFWIQWKVLEYESKSGWKTIVEPVNGIWYSNFENIIHLIKDKEYPVHSYLRRRGDTEGNAKDSYLIDLRDLKQLAAFC